jgi:SOS-response transcriptional repressor LexA
MSRVGALIRGIRLAKQLDLPQMAYTLGTTPSRLQLVETGAVFPAAIERRRWGVKLGFKDLADFDHHWRDSWGKITAAHRDGWVPIINKAPAGPVTDYEEYGIDSGIGFEYVPRPAGLEGELLFAVIVIGDSMMPAYREGDLVIFRPIKPDEDIPDGSPVFVRFTSQYQHGCTFKTVYRRGDGLMNLRAENPRYETMVITSDDVERMAIAVDRRPEYCVPKKQMRIVRDEYVQEFPAD